MHNSYIPLSDRSRPPVPHEDCMWFGISPDGIYYVRGYKDRLHDVVVEYETDERYSISLFLAYQPLRPPHNFWCRKEFSRQQQPAMDRTNVVPFRKPVKVGRTL